MVRQCAANGCNETDSTMTTHRFPKDKEVAQKWMDALEITGSTVPELQKGFIVCTKHFAPSSYRNEISNSLNTTAIPNLEQNVENERQFLKDKNKHPFVSPRCFKLPPNVNFQPEVQVFRCVKRTANDENQPVAKKHANVVVHTLGESLTDAPETFEVQEYVIEENEAEKSPRPLRNAASRLAPVAEVASVPKVPKPLQTKKVRAQQSAKVAHTPSQTEEPAAQESQRNDNGSKDDKIVALLYPEYCDISKVYLIEQVKEKEQRIVALEEKVKKLEQAMRSLL